MVNITDSRYRLMQYILVKGNVIEVEMAAISKPIKSSVNHIIYRVFHNLKRSMHKKARSSNSFNLIQC